MPNRLDIELTSARGDGSYTWRAAGARQPKGVIDGKILSETAKVGDVLRVEAEVEIDGITILSVLPPKEKAAPTGRIELIGSPKPVASVTTVLVNEGGRSRGDRRDLLDSPRRSDSRAGRERRPPRGDRPDSRRPGSPGAETGERRPERRPGSEPSSQGARPPRASGERRTERRPRTETPAAERATGTETASERGRQPRQPRSPAAGDRTRPAATPRVATRRTPSRFEPGTAHRDALLSELAPEQRPIAERLAAGGIPAVRRAIAEEREKARTEHRPELSGDAILTLAEQLAPSVKQATWLDRAEAAVSQLDHLSLRDLRTTVAAAAPRDEAGRELDRKLREELDRRVKKLRAHWEEQITHALEEGRVLQALRFSAQPPEPTARFPAGLIERLSSAAGAAMTATTPVERWLALLDAATASPIRRQIHPAGMPEDPSGEVPRRARLASGSIPALAPMLGLAMPPPPKPIPSARPMRTPRPGTHPGRRPARSNVRANEQGHAAQDHVSAEVTPAPDAGGKSAPAAADVPAHRDEERPADSATGPGEPEQPSEPVAETAALSQAAESAEIAPDQGRDEASPGTNGAVGEIDAGAPYDASSPLGADEAAADPVVSPTETVES